MLDGFGNILMHGHGCKNGRTAVCKDFGIITQKKAHAIE